MVNYLYSGVYTLNLDIYHKYYQFIILKYYLCIYIKSRYLSFFKRVKAHCKDDSWPVEAGRTAGVMWFISLVTESGQNSYLLSVWLWCCILSKLYKIDTNMLFTVITHKLYIQYNWSFYHEVYLSQSLHLMFSNMLMKMFY